MGEHVSMKRKREDKEAVKIKFEPGKSEALISVEDVMILTFIQFVLTRESH